MICCSPCSLPLSLCVPSMSVSSSSSRTHLAGCRWCHGYNPATFLVIVFHEVDPECGGQDQTKVFGRHMWPLSPSHHFGNEYDPNRGNRMLAIRQTSYLSRVQSSGVGKWKTYTQTDRQAQLVAIQITSTHTHANTWTCYIFLPLFSPMDRNERFVHRMWHY